MSVVMMFILLQILQAGLKTWLSINNAQVSKYLSDTLIANTEAYKLRLESENHIY